MVELLVDICLIDSPSNCNKFSVTYFAEKVTPYSCANNSMPYLAKEMESRPNWRIAKFSCKELKNVVVNE